MMRRVVVTGMSGVTSLGETWGEIRQRMEQGQTGIRYMHEWDDCQDLNTRLGGPIDTFEPRDHYNRKALRTAGRVAALSMYASERALEMAGLKDDPERLHTGRAGVAYGSSFGNVDPVIDFARLLTDRTARNLNAASYVRMMSHTSAVNIGIHLGLTGRVLPTSSACTSGSMGIGFAYEAIRDGQQDIMLAGGAEEMSVGMSAVFDTLFSTSAMNDHPGQTPRPYDSARDGLVIGEGAGTLILEEFEHAAARDAPVVAEIVGFGTNSDGSHATRPQSDTMQIALRLALQDAGLEPESIGFVSGHGTATDAGDIAEVHATSAVFDRAVPMHSLKGHFGHSLGACGAIEAWLAIEMMNDGWFPATANLSDTDPRCLAVSAATPDFLIGVARDIQPQFVMSNNFAFGGINTSLIFKKV
ncbi:beta-ketoacyl-ACP synthase [Ruegeria sp. ANG-R]|uniref:beta-ketoacyl-ACP synthase n=1 Tax=Ruegeria sp. ANG-R TaxID=1577903 RepID=UPI000ACE0599|nr:beta-ketoacyl-ACP synthase [Ruegeria sp. ANG-R]